MGKNLQDRIKELDEYRPDISYRDGAFILKIKFKAGWSVIESEDKRVAYSEDSNVKGLHWYVSNIEDADMIFDLIEETIAVNKEMEKKLLLYKEKVKELQELFLSDIPYEKLITLQFTFPDNTKKGKSKQRQKQILQDDIVSEDKVNSPDTIVSEVSVPTEIKETEINDIDKKIAEALG